VASEPVHGAKPHFIHVTDWADVEKLVDLEPLVPAYAAGVEHRTLAVFVRDHTQREIACPRMGQSVGPPVGGDR
jgi:hypothetical protein